jgi:hypothetical protein
MSIDPVVRTLWLGLSVEKGEEPPCAKDRQMNRRTWDWPRLARIRPGDFGRHLNAISSQLGRPIAVVLETSRAGSETRQSVPFILARGTLLKHAAPVEIADLVERLHEIDAARDTWADVFIFAEFTEDDVGRMLPKDVAVVLRAFGRLRDCLRPSIGR